MATVNPEFTQAPLPDPSAFVAQLLALWRKYGLGAAAQRQAPSQLPSARTVWDIQDRILANPAQPQLPIWLQGLAARAGQFTPDERQTAYRHYVLGEGVAPQWQAAQAAMPSNVRETLTKVLLGQS